jgi:UTP--glucose-1-phosphate uridylyltransferase
VIRKAVIPAAGLGTRFLPASKAIPKEMMPVDGRPVIEHVVAELSSAGVRDILLVISRTKRSIEEHFDRAPELENLLERKGDRAGLDAVRAAAQLADLHFVWQPAMRGLGDAVLRAEGHVGGEPFLLHLGDTIVENSPSVAARLSAAYERFRSPVVLLERVPPERAGRYGIMRGTEIGPGTYRIDDFVEKPRPGEAPSDLAIAGRYLLTPDVFPLLARTEPGNNGEVQLTDALRTLARNGPFHGIVLEGMRHDIGNPDDFLRTNLTFALRDPARGAALRRFLQDLL